MPGGTLTVSIATALVMAPTKLVTTTSKLPASLAWTLASPSVGLLAPLTLPPLFSGFPPLRHR